MNHHVVWHPAAFDVMQAVVRAHPQHRTYLAGVLAEISAALRTHPDEVGESREEEHDRVGFFGPFTLWFRVLSADRRVEVLRVQLTTLLL